MTRPTVPWWASRPTKDVITICLMVATGMACGLFMARSQRDWVCETTLGAGALGTVVDMTENGALAAVARPDGRITVHDLARHGVVQELQAESGAPSAVAVSVDGQHMAVGFPDAPVKLWPPNTRAKPVALGEGTSGAVGLAFSGDGRRLACYTSDDLLSVWQVPDGERLSASRFSGVGEAKYVRLRFSDEEKAVVVFPLWAGSTAMDGLEIETGNRVRFYGEESGGNGKGVAFPTTLVDYTSRWYKLEGQLPNGHEVAFAGMVMKPWGRGSRPRGQSTLFQLAPGHVLGGGHNAIAFDAEADRAVYASADERVYQMRQAEAGGHTMGRARFRCGARRVAHPGMASGLTLREGGHGRSCTGSRTPHRHRPQTATGPSHPGVRGGGRRGGHLGFNGRRRVLRPPGLKTGGPEPLRGGGASEIQAWVASVRALPTLVSLLPYGPPVDHVSRARCLAGALVPRRQRDSRTAGPRVGWPGGALCDRLLGFLGIDALAHTAPVLPAPCGTRRDITGAEGRITQDGR